MRAFISLVFDRSTKEKIADIQKIIRSKSVKGRFKYIDNFHITLKFLGEVEEKVLHSIFESLKLVLKEEKAFRLSIDSLGSFGHGDIIRTLYLGIGGEIERLIQIHSIVNKVIEGKGFKPEKNFSPHITIAQEVKLSGSFEELRKDIRGIKIENLEFDKIIIMKSEQSGNKRVYTPIYTIQLKEINKEE